MESKHETSLNDLLRGFLRLVSMEHNRLHKLYTTERDGGGAVDPKDRNLMLFIFRELATVAASQERSVAKRALDRMNALQLDRYEDFVEEERGTGWGRFKLS